LTMFSARPCFECPRSRYATNASEPVQNMPQSGLWRKPVAATVAKLLRTPPAKRHHCPMDLAGTAQGDGG
jgi:hypothetical protein